MELESLQEMFKAPSSLYLLSDRQWRDKKVKFVRLLFGNVFDRWDLYLEVEDNRANVGYYLLKLKTKQLAKPNGWVIKGCLQTEDWQEDEILAVKFRTEEDAKEFKRQFDACVKTIIDKRKARLYVREQLQKKPWICAVCAASNPKNTQTCSTCEGSRWAFIDPESKSRYSRRPSKSFGSTSETDQLYLEKERRRSYLGDTMASSVSPVFKRNSTLSVSYLFQSTRFENLLNNKDLEALEEPSVSDNGWTCPRCAVRKSESTDICYECGIAKASNFRRSSSSLKGSSVLPIPTREDFENCILKVYLSNREVCNTLKSVTRKLRRPEPKYRILNGNKKIVHDKLFMFEGVRHYLGLLGFSAESVESKRLTCPKDWPPKEVIDTALAVLDSFIVQYNRSQLELSGFNLNELDSNQKSDYSNEYKKQSSKPIRTKFLDMEVKVSESNEENLRKQFIKLVNSVTHPEKHGRFTEILLLFHRSFDRVHGSYRLLDALKERFIIGGNFNKCSSNSRMSKESNNKAFIIRSKVENILTKWLTVFWTEDFEGEKKLVENLALFIEKIEQDEYVNIPKLRKCWNRLMSAEQNKSTLVLQDGSSSVRLFLPNWDADVDSKVIAEQLTLLSWRVFQKMKPREFLGQAWKTESRERDAPNILGYIRNFNHVCKWIQLKILHSPKLKSRIKVMERMIEIGTACMSLRSFSMLFAVHSALNSQSIFRLSESRRGIRRQYRKPMKQWKELFSVDKNSAKLREAHQKAAPPAIPWLGIFLQDLVFYEDGNPDIQPNGDFNLQKCDRINRRIQWLCAFQQQKYTEIHSNSEILNNLQAELKETTSFDEEGIWNLSTTVKTKDEEEAERMSFF